MKKIIILILILTCSFNSCSEGSDGVIGTQTPTTFTFTHNWEGELVTNADFNALNFTNENGEILSIERLRYVISDIVFTTSSNEKLALGSHHLIDVTNTNNLSFTTQTRIPSGNYNVSFKFGLDNEDNAQNHTDLNTASFNVPDNLGGGYHFMQLDGKFINSNSEEQGYNYHAIRAVDNPGPNPTFPQDTFIDVNLGNVQVSNTTEIEVKMDISEWFKNPNRWDLNAYNQMLMPNSAAQIMMYQNGHNAFSLGAVTP